MSTTAERLLIAIEHRHSDQSKLARSIGVTQGAISKILLGKTANSRLLPRIAAHLGVNLNWLLGVSADPGFDLPASTTPSAPEVAHVMLPVALPSETALADMFEGMLLAIDREQSLDAVARELAQLLPTGLSTLQGRLLELPRPPRAPGPSAFPAPAAPAAAEAPARADREYQR